MQLPSPPPAPRAIPSGRTVSFGGLFGLLFGGIWAVAGIVLSVVFTVMGGPFWDDLILDSHASRAPAVVLDATPTSTRVNRRRVYDVTLQFRDGAGAVHTVTRPSVDADVRSAAGTNAPVQVEYDPTHPERCRVAGRRASAMGLAGLGPLGVALAGTVTFVFGLLALLRARALYRTGEAAMARVVGVRPTAMKINRKRVYEASVDFDGPNGRTRGKYTTLDVPAEGAEVWILFDREDPRRMTAA